MKSNNSKNYDLEERTFVFAKNVIEYVRNLPKGIAYSEIGKQLVRSADSVGAKYIEANESLSKNDFKCYSYKAKDLLSVFALKLCRIVRIAIV